jgi:hypothetical protein
MGTDSFEELKLQAEPFHCCSVAMHKGNGMADAAQLMFENCALLGYYATSSAFPLPTFPDNLSVPSSRVKKSTQRRVVILYRRFGTTYRPHLQRSRVQEEMKAGKKLRSYTGEGVGDDW